MSESDAESNELEAEIMASFLLRPVIVYESTYTIYSTWKAMSAFEISLIKTEDAFEGYSFRICDEWHHLKANYYWSLDQCIGWVMGESKGKLQLNCYFHVI